MDKEIWGSKFEILLAVVVCVLALFGPLLFIQLKYDAFLEAHGSIREGAAGATVALAVILRAVTRTILRTVVRTSARAGIKVSMRGAVKSTLRVTGRNVLAGVMRNVAAGSENDEGEILHQHPKGNLANLAIASVLLYISWIIVVGFGQPFRSMNEDGSSSSTAAIPESTNRIQPGERAYELQQKLLAQRDAIRALDRQIKEPAEPLAQADLLEERQQALEALSLINIDFLDEFVRAGGRVIGPENKAKVSDTHEIDKAIDAFFTPAAYSGVIPWSSPVIWLGGLVFIVPMWIIHLIMTLSARRHGATLHSETGWDGALIQLYFAGAFSFMPLAVDMKIDGDSAARGKVAVAGLVMPALISLGCWTLWTLTGRTMAPLLLAADAFLIYPLVQVFPISPLFGVEIWQWRRSVWTAVFFGIMIGFILIGSEGLKHVI